MVGNRQAKKLARKNVKIRIEPHPKENHQQWMCRCTKNKAIKHNALLRKKKERMKLHIRAIVGAQCSIMWLKARRLDGTTEGNII